MNLQEMAATAKEHWRAENPEVFWQMQRNGDLDAEAIAAAKLTWREMQTLMRGGATEAEAWQASRELFILVDPAKTYNP